MNIDLNQNQIDYGNIALALAKLSEEKEEFLAIIPTNSSKSPEELYSMEISSISSNEPLQLSPQNFLSYMVNSLKKIRLDQPINQSGSKDIAILPQAKADETFKDMYDFNVEKKPKEYDLDSSLNDVFKDESATDNTQGKNSDQNLLKDQISDSSSNSISYVGLQHQLVTSVRQNQPPSQYTSSNSQNNLPPISAQNSLSSLITPSRGSNSWFLFFGKAQQYSNPMGLIETSPDAQITSQLQLEQQVEQQVQQRTQSIKR
jgi:formate dehydrogenase maturation protein FdhE